MFWKTIVGGAEVLFCFFVFFVGFFLRLDFMIYVQKDKNANQKAKGKL